MLSRANNTNKRRVPNTAYVVSVRKSLLNKLSQLIYFCINTFDLLINKALGNLKLKKCNAFLNNRNVSGLEQLH